MRLRILLSILALPLSLSAQGDPAHTEATARYRERVREEPRALAIFLTEMPKGGDLHSHLSGAVYAESYLRWAADDGLCVNVPRRAIQRAYNEEHGITPETIVKGISDITEFLMTDSKVPTKGRRRREKRIDMEPGEIESTIVELEEEMLAAAEELRFEYAAKLRDEIRELRRELDIATSA